MNPVYLKTHLINPPSLLLQCLIAKKKRKKKKGMLHSYSGDGWGIRLGVFFFQILNVVFVTAALPLFTH